MYDQARDDFKKANRIESNRTGSRQSAGCTALHCNFGALHSLA
jgi:hypothetical protein